jgi:hypothetical protein
MSTWVKLRDAVEAFFTGPVAAFISPFLKAIEQQGPTLLIAAAENAVAAGFAAPGAGEAKMVAALASFSAEMVAKGLPFVESQARALIEVALQNAKAATAPAPALAA